MCGNGRPRISCRLRASPQIPTKIIRSRGSIRARCCAEEASPPARGSRDPATEISSRPSATRSSPGFVPARCEGADPYPLDIEASMKQLVAALALSSALWASEVVAQEKPALVFTAIPDQDETRLVELFTRVAGYLQAKLGVPVKYLPVKSYPAAVTAFTNGQVQLAWFGGFTGVQARRQVAGSEAIAQGAEDVAFKSFFIANAKTGLAASNEFPKQIAGKSFTFGSRASTSGRLMP